MINKYKLVLIEWEDSQLGFQGWKFINEQTHELPTYISVGFLVHEDEKYKVLYPHIKDVQGDDELAGSGDILIPVSAIRKQIELSIPPS